MGVYLPKPKIDKESEDGGDSDSSGTRFGLTAMQGWRQYMEDAHLANPKFNFNGLPNSGLFGVFDGHGGPAVSAWVAKVFDSTLRDELASVKHGLSSREISPETKGMDEDIVLVCEALQRTFLKLDEAMKSESNRQQLKELHEEAEKKKKQDQEEESEDGAERHPESLLEAIFSGIGGRKPFVRMIEQDGQKFFQLISRDISDDDDDDDSDERNQGNAGRFEDLGESGDGIDEGGGEKKQFYGEEGGETELTIGLDRAASRSDEELEKVLSSTAMEGQKQKQGRKQTDRHLKTAMDEDSEDEKMESTEEGSEEGTGNVDELMPELAGLSSDGKQMQPYQPECCGTTAIVAMVVECDPPVLITANAGDSRAVLSRNGHAVALSKDHKPGLGRETDRIVKAGGKVLNGRVDGNLNLSRSIGDLFYKRDTSLSPKEQKITAYPDIRITPLTPEDEFAVIACDGIWDCITNHKAVEIVRQKLADLAIFENEEKATQLSKICEEICDTYISKNPLESEGGIGCDNMTIMIVQFKSSLLSKAKQYNSDNSPSIFYGIEPDLSDMSPTEQ